MKSLSKTETPIFLSVVCSLFPKAIFLMFSQMSVHCRSVGHRFDLSWVQQHSSVEVDHEIFSAVILFLLLIQEGQLSQSCKNLHNYWLVTLRTKPAQEKVQLGKLTGSSQPRWLSYIWLVIRRLQVQPPHSFLEIWSWNILFGNSLPSAHSRRAVVSFWRKNMHNTG